MATSQMADDLNEIRRYLGFDSIQLIGHSNGGSIALSFASRYPGACHKLVLVDSQLIGFPAREATAEILKHRASDERFATALTQFSRWGDLVFDDAAVTEFVMSLLPLYLYDPELNLAKIVNTLQEPIDSWAAQKQREMDSLEEANQLELPTKIEADTLVIVGQDDFITPVPVSDRIAKDTARSRLSVFEKCGHFPWIEKENKFFKTVSDFLSGSAIP